jgi:hypothetical protein
MKQSTALMAMNRGIVSPLGLARVDQKRIAMGAEEMTNWVPRVLGSMSLRPGWQYLFPTSSNGAARYLEFIFSTTDTALIELTNLKMRIVISDALISRPSVASTIANGNFDTNLTSWTDADEAGGTSAWVSGGYMGLTGNGTAAAIRRQQVTVSALNQGTEHALRIVIQRGPVTLRVGSTSGGDEYINETTLLTGAHSLAFTPSGDFYVQFSSRLQRQVLVDSCNVEGSGIMEVTTPWTTSDLNNVRHDQSGDVVFIACEGKQQRRIERRASRSWSVVTYAADDGPFMVENTSPTTITPSALVGNITLTASAPLFRSSHVGGLFRITSTGQEVTATATAQNTFTSAIRVSGVSTSRTYTIIISGLSGTGSTVTRQQSLDSENGPWTDVATYTADTTATTNDTLDNQIAWYRIGVDTGDYVAGTIVMTLDYAIGSVDGITRITGFTNSTSVSAEVLSDLGGTEASDVWSEGEWSDYRGWPTAVRIHEGRLWWFGMDGIWGSISDAFDSFDENFEGDAAPINRTIGSGPVDVINWGLSLQRLIIGSQGAELSCRSSSLDEPLTPTNFNIKAASTQGSAAVEAVKIDQRGVYVQRNGINVYELAFDSNGYDYGSKDLTLIVPELGLPGIIRMAVQRKPDTRIHCIRSDGTVMMAVFDSAEDMLCWNEIETDGLIEDVVVLPSASGSTEDQVYYVVNRTINGSTVRYLEKWAKETECRGGTLNKQADSFLIYSGAATNVITGLGHLEGESVIVWGDGVDLSPTTSSGVQTTYTVSGGQIRLANAVTVTNAIIGLSYRSLWKSAKLGIGEPTLSTLTRDKKINFLGLIMAYVHAKGIRYGSSFDYADLRDMPEIENGTTVSSSAVRTSYDEQKLDFPGGWDTDSRLCLVGQAPRPCTVLAAITDLDIS